MLIKKKADKKKMMIYFAIIGVMVGATAFLILKNVKIGNDVADDPSIFAIDTGVQPQENEVVVPKINLEKDNPMQILDDPRFKGLEDVDFTENDQGRKKVGRKNPFEPKELKQE